MRITQDDRYVYVHNVATGKAHFMLEHGGVWCADMSTWRFASLPADFEKKYRLARFEYDQSCNPRASAGQIVASYQAAADRLASAKDEYHRCVWRITEEKARWLDGNVPVDEKTDNNVYACPFSTKNDPATGVVVCFVGMLPALKNGALCNGGRYGYVIGHYLAVLDRVSNMRRQVGVLLRAAPMRLLDGPEMRGVVVFEIDMYSGGAMPAWAK